MTDHRNIIVLARKQVHATRTEHRFDVLAEGRLIADALPISEARKVLARLDVRPQEADTLLRWARRAA